jgi:SOS response regulatory protein OraA/RecX
VAADDERAAALDRAARALARRDHSAAGLSAKLERAGVSELARSAAVDTLRHRGYVDDARFARERAARLAERGYGDEWIRGDLERQGVDRAVSDAAVAALESERSRASSEAARLGGGVRALRSLARRGFSESALESVAAAVVAEDVAEGVGYEGSI